MANLYIDENVPVRCATRLQSLEHSVVVGFVRHGKGASDHVHFVDAVRLGRTLITHNAHDYVLLHLAWRDWCGELDLPPFPAHQGVLIIEQPPALSADAAADLVDAFISTLPDVESLINRCFRWRRPTGWQEQI